MLNNLDFEDAFLDAPAAKQFFSSWTLEEALTLARLIEPVVIQHGYHTALGGGVLLKGKSNKDVDIMLYERTKDYKSSTPEAVFEELKKIGFSAGFYQCKHGGSAADIGEYKKVFVGRFFGKRVDLFFLRNAAPVSIDC